MSGRRPTILWLRRDLRLGDHPALTAAVARGGPVIAVFIHDEHVAALGAAAKWRLGLSLDHFDKVLRERGSRLVLRRGSALDVLRALVAETGADAVMWSRLHDPGSVTRDKDVKSALKDDGLQVSSHPGHLLFEPWTVATGEGGYYRVYTPFWRAVRGRDVTAPLPAPGRLPVPARWPQNETLDDWHMGADMHRGAAICGAYQRVGETAAEARLDWFAAQAIDDYATARNRPDMDGCSGLSENLTYGEISPRRCWHAGLRAQARDAAGADAWLSELGWRDFAWHLIWHTPHITERSWRKGWERFPWRSAEDNAELRAWCRGRTGVPFVDAAMREMYVTGRMHNRGRMIVASYLTKHLMTHWRHGMDWFADCLTDWDPASNAMGWQWAAGSGPDAAPYFRIFNPDTQAQKFDPEGTYRRRWIAEGQRHPPDTALSYFRAVPRGWGLDPTTAAAYPDPVVPLGEGRARALAAYQARDF